MNELRVEHQDLTQRQREIGRELRVLEDRSATLGRALRELLQELGVWLPVLVEEQRREREEREEREDPSFQPGQEGEGKE